ncbi:ROK family protein [Guptibacillus hwajinpoensis]|uniref:ROK family protein n=1 Tax=Guptibacillus hwajinpoensis TaxID=208199 RepID=UPI0024B38B77|nr:ROK family protein [Pseudalkalibacillus hwajinpoensis]
MNLSLGIDVGGTKIAAALITKDGRVLFRKEVPSVTTDKDKMFQQLKNCIDQVLKESRYKPENLLGIGIGVPGKVDIENGIAIYQNNLPWSHFPIGSKLEELYPTKSVILDNDVHMAAFSEWYQRGCKKNETFAYLTISTGISCCILHNGAILRGAGFAGEVGLMLTSASKENSVVTFENVASGPAIQSKAATKRATLQMKETEQITTATVLRDYFHGEKYACHVMAEVLNDISKGIHGMICMLDPHQIVLGGGVINHNPELIDHIKATLKPLLITEQSSAVHRISVSQLKGDSGLVGAGLRLHNSSDGGANED